MITSGAESGLSHWVGPSANPLERDRVTDIDRNPLRFRSVPGPMGDDHDLTRIFHVVDQVFKLESWQRLWIGAARFFGWVERFHGYPAGSLSSRRRVMGTIWRLGIEAEGYMYRPAR